MDLVVRAAFVFVFLWFLLRGLGKRELAQMTPFELVLLVVLGDLVQQAVTLEDHSITGAVIVVSTLALLTATVSLIGHRSGRFAAIFEGRPSQVWRAGAPVHELLRQERIRVDELAAEARKQGIGSLDAVSVATLETDGKISFLTRDGLPEPPRDPPDPAGSAV
jgi:uncharacterized membrane protein YcaP (DUF421 family)